MALESKEIHGNSDEDEGSTLFWMKTMASKLEVLIFIPALRTLLQTAPVTAGDHGTLTPTWVHRLQIETESCSHQTWPLPQLGCIKKILSMNIRRICDIHQLILYTWGGSTYFQQYEPVSLPSCKETKCLVAKDPQSPYSGYLRESFGTIYSGTLSKGMECLLQVMSRHVDRLGKLPSSLKDSSKG